MCSFFYYITKIAFVFYQITASQGQGQTQQQGFNGWSVFKTLLFRMLIIYMISQWFRKSNTPTNKTSDGQLQGPFPASNIFGKETYMDLYVYITEEEMMTKFDESNLFWMEEGMPYDGWTGGQDGEGTYTMTGKLPISESVQNNGSLYIHVYFVKNGFSPNPSDVERYHSQHVVYKKKLLNKFKKRRFHTMKNLLTGTTDAHADLVRNATESKFEIISHWHPNLTINLVNDQTGFVKGSIPAPLDEYVVFLPGDIHYYPILYFNDYWNLNSEYTPINSTTKVLNLTLTYYPLSLFKWQMYAAQGMQNKWFNMFGEDLVENNDEEQDSLKRAFIETNPYLLFITIVVSLVHSVFEFLAFKNDIQFWRNRKSLEGLSVRSVFFNVFQSVVVLLYVLDNETNFVIKVSVFVGLLIEIWKIQKVIDIQLDRENKWFDRIPMIKIKDKSTYTESQTKKYDLMAFRYLSWLLFPLLICYAVYSVLYLEHKGWYSWVLSMLYGFLLTFGFIMMTPQLFINYKLKSVAHLPWRMLTYKALNTFIDDLFAFVIRMPMLYRLGCFRDDIIFCIYLYQRWIYRVDPKRINEFGTSAEMMEDETLQTPAITASPTPSSTSSTSPESVEADKTIESRKF
ncbi:hypothetical protein HELRODRAFT_64937 [Helobdella robusta]|uniref:Uncharacterized protein n=1 Tax=Helobdella robusta TaxID=6412 RepID=T1FY16_HELRO|nr:hypothetical protein HELRODRAFT_64937 [Helobdella robusta]ESO06447.1 hypothetical protein HELRODRAFT_64937 [Helobdella robusta]